MKRCPHCDKPILTDQALKEIEEVLGDETKLWDIFTLSQGCKTQKEDCCFNRCHSWGRCNQLTIEMGVHISTIGRYCKSHKLFNGVIWKMV